MESCRVSGEREKDRKRFVNTVNFKKKNHTVKNVGNITYTKYLIWKKV